MTKPQKSTHTFHIAVLGIGFSVDTPVKVAKYGISSVISLVNDRLIEKARVVVSKAFNEPYEPISEKDRDRRAKRITSYLNMLGRIVKRQVKELQESPFEEGSEITRYFEMLPDSETKRMYEEMLTEEDPARKERIQSELRTAAVPGRIDANIMTKLDVDRYENGEKLPVDFSDALAAFRGYAESDLENSAMVLSAGLNPRMYGYIGKFKDFQPDENGHFKKEVILKVSDYRSAEVQGKFLATRGIWVSEYRIESGLNCGGHAFPTHGLLIGPILQVFKEKRSELQDKTFENYKKTLEKNGRKVDFKLPPVRITVQGGIGTAEENDFLLNYYSVDATGWGTPFLLVPEVTNVDDEHLQKLLEASEDDIWLSEDSPSTIPFWSLKTADGEIARDKKNAAGNPGSSCPNDFLALSNEFTERPLCTASIAYVKKKLQELTEGDYTEAQRKYLTEKVLTRTCLCRDLCSSFEKKHGMNEHAVPIICCGPNIVNFKKIASLSEMVSHIYGRISLIANNERAHMFVNECKIYVDFMKKELKEYSLGVSNRMPKYFTEYRDNLMNGIEYYRNLAETLLDDEARKRFLRDLNELSDTLTALYASHFEPVEGLV